ncbi:MAG TPA: XrtA/PEP-CTERM system histidine kinase PrsK [Casimicrobiaceae bacterium]|nr:XrtA/PEP-CTERM system histidine kinase PrsK [Casimicrobiaceae bacterium]
MTESSFATAGAVSYGIAAIGWLLLALRIGIGLKGNRRGATLLVVALVTAVWAALGVLYAARKHPAAFAALDAADALRGLAWLAFVAILLRSATGAGGRPGLPRWLVVVAAVLAGGSLLLLDGLRTTQELLGNDLRPDFALRVGFAIVGLVVAEQLFRRVDPQGRWATKPLVLAMLGVFGYDLYMFSDALLFGRIDPDIWVARGAANALVIPLVMMATARNAGWTVEMHLSREAVFQSTALLVSGAFLLAIAGAGYIVRYIGGDWGRALQIELLFAAGLLVVLVTTSGRFRSRLRVFVSKHFFSYRYDYREEWLRFTRTLATDTAIVGLQERAIMALADLVESPGGALWLADERGDFRPAARLNMPPVDGALPAASSLPRFLGETGWIVTIPEAVQHPDRYRDLELPGWLSGTEGAWLVIPLATRNDVVGFILLLDPRTPIDVDWEVRDLLKAAARAAAAYLQQLRASEALLEARKFDAFNRMSAFVVHDLKNLVAQLSLMLRNAERHRDNPAFQRDMLETVAHVVGRMNALMLQLRTGTTPVENPRPVELGAIARRVVEAKGRAGAVALALDGDVVALGHEDRLEHVIGHLVQNAIDAVQAGGTMSVAVRRDGAAAVLEVADTGPGMSASFVRDRLFKPFETTKPSGMGIGVYESQQYVASLGGRIDVDSGEGRGTRVVVRLPAAEMGGGALRGEHAARTAEGTAT